MFPERTHISMASCCFVVSIACQSAKTNEPPLPPEPAVANTAAAAATAAPVATNTPSPAVPAAATSAAPSEPSKPKIPDHNRADLAAPPQRPPAGSAEARARQLFEAIRLDQPALASDFFFPRDAFLLVKAIRDPGKYWDNLRQRYDADIHALHRSTRDLDTAQFESLEIVPRGGWTPVHKEANALPYWTSRHSLLHYRVGEQHRKLEVRVLITWDDEWFITHLSEFH